MMSQLLFQDSILYASEVYTQDMNAEMVVLSSCESGVGKIEKGEGVMSLSRAFSYAGVPACVMSLWKVSDKQTPKVIVPFYEYLEKGNNKSKALQKAKLSYLKNTKDNRFKHPYYWAGFVLNGDDVALGSRIKTEDIIILVILSIIPFLIFFVKKRNLKAA